MNVFEADVIMDYIQRLHIYRQLLQHYEQTGETLEKYVTIFDTTYMIKITADFFSVEGLEIEGGPAEPCLYLYGTDGIMMYGRPIEQDSSSENNQ